VSQGRPFEITVPDTVLDDLRNRLDRTRPARGAVTGWSVGTNPGYLASFVTSWARAYQWRDTESALNALPQTLVSVADVDIHVFHIRARTSAAGAAPVPLVLTHGLPGFGFSGPLPAGQNHPARIADLWAELMDQLGYQRFGAYGGDIGSRPSPGGAGCGPRNPVANAA
jgi:epoxide hydrolase